MEDDCTLKKIEILSAIFPSRGLRAPYTARFHKNGTSEKWGHKYPPSFSIQLHCFLLVVNVMYSHLAYLERSCKKAFTSIREWHSRKANISRIATSETFPPRKRHFNVKCLFFKSNIRYILRALFRHTLDGIRFKQYYTNTKTDRWSCALPNISG